MSKTSYTLYEVASLNIPTIPFEEYVDEEQLEEGKTYKIGAIKNWNQNKLQKPEVCKSKEEQYAYIKELHRIYGNRAIIIIQEYVSFKQSGTLIIRKGGYDISGEVTEEDRKKMEGWIALLSDGYLFIRDIYCLWIKNTKDEILLTGIF